MLSNLSTRSSESDDVEATDATAISRPERRHSWMVSGVTLSGKAVRHIDEQTRSAAKQAAKRKLREMVRRREAG